MAAELYSETMTQEQHDLYKRLPRVRDYLLGLQKNMQESANINTLLTLLSERNDTYVDERLKLEVELTELIYARSSYDTYTPIKMYGDIDALDKKIADVRSRLKELN